MMNRMLKFPLDAPLILAAALVVGPCRLGFAQGDADLEAVCTKNPIHVDG
jgi:hypothetical protein